MCAKADDVIEPLQPPTGAVPGDVVSFDKFPGAVAVVLCGGFFRGMGGGVGEGGGGRSVASRHRWSFLFLRALSPFFFLAVYLCVSE